MNIKIEPRKTTDRGGYLMLPLIKNIPYPANDTWKKSTCPKCGAECWDRQLPPGFTEDMFSGKMCTECALRMTVQEKAEMTTARAKTLNRPYWTFAPEDPPFSQSDGVNPQT